MKSPQRPHSYGMRVCGSCVVYAEAYGCRRPPSAGVRWHVADVVAGVMVQLDRDQVWGLGVVLCCATLPQCAHAFSCLVRLYVAYELTRGA